MVRIKVNGTKLVNTIFTLMFIPLIVSVCLCINDVSNTEKELNKSIIEYSNTNKELSVHTEKNHQILLEAKKEIKLNGLTEKNMYYTSGSIKEKEIKLNSKVIRRYCYNVSGNYSAIYDYWGNRFKQRKRTLYNKGRIVLVVYTDINDVDRYRRSTILIGGKLKDFYHYENQDGEEIKDCDYNIEEEDRKISQLNKINN